MEKLKNNLVPTDKHLALTEPNLYPKGLKPYPFQLLAVAFALARPITYLALDPGLGKTIIAAMIHNAFNLKTPTKVFYISPPFLVANVDNEFSNWCGKNKNIHIISDSKFNNELTLARIKRDYKNFKGKKILIVDEAHRFKNPKSNRSSAVYKIAKQFEHVVFMSGTPMPNSRPIELWPILGLFAPDVFGDKFFPFAKKYCGAYKDRFGWKFDGFTNRKEFKERIFNSFMLRLKKDVIDLPDRIEGIVTIGSKMPAVISKLEKKILEHYTKEDLVEGKLAKIAGKATLHISEYLRLLGEYKLKYAMPYIEHLLFNTKDNLVIFAQHKKVISDLELYLANFRPCVITGATPMQKRQAIVNEYQNDETRRVFLGNLKACGIGITITKGNRVLILEPSWVDGENQQAIDRVHRIGQKKNILAQYLVLKDSIDKKRLEVVLAKRSKSI